MIKRVLKIVNTSRHDTAQKASANLLMNLQALLANSLAKLAKTGLRKILMTQTSNCVRIYKKLQRMLLILSVVPAVLGLAQLVAPSVLSSTSVTGVVSFARLSYL